MQKIKEKNTIFKIFSAVIVLTLLISQFSSMAVFAASTPKITLTSVDCNAGDSIEIPISLSNNPGFVNMSLTLTYDKYYLTLTGVEDKGLIGQLNNISDYSVYPYGLTWEGDSAPANFTANGTIAILKFKVAENTPSGKYNVTVSYDKNNSDILNYDMENVDFEIFNGTVTIKSKTPAHTQHSFGEGKVTKQPTCTETGVKTYTCSCGETKTESIPATGHKAGDWEITVNADCTNNGKKVQKCTVCKQEIASESIQAPGHIFTDYVENGDGTKTAKCDRCDETNTISSTEVTLISYDEVKMSVAAGYVPELPETVIANYSDGTSKEVAVVWATIGRSSFMTPGKVVEIKGVVFENGASVPNISGDTVPVVLVEVNAPLIISVNDVKVNTVVGTAPMLPETVTAALSNDTTAQIKVDWNSVDPASYAQVGKFTVTGSIEDNGSYEISDEFTLTEISDDIALALISCTVNVTEKNAEKPEEKPTDEPEQKPDDIPEASDKPAADNTASDNENDDVIENVQTGEATHTLPLFAFIASTLTMGLALAHNKFRQINDNLF